MQADLRRWAAVLVSLLAIQAALPLGIHLVGHRPPGPPVKVQRAAPKPAGPTVSGGTAPAPPLRIARTVAVQLQGSRGVTGPLRLSAIDFTSPRVGWLAGSRCDPGGACRGVLLVTHDGGTTWQTSTVAPAPLTGLQFLSGSNGSIGWAFGPGALLGTRDGGRTWTRLAAPAVPNRELQAITGLDVSFASPDDGWLIWTGGGCATQGCGVSVYQSRDGGRSWRLIATNGLPGQPRTPLMTLPWAAFIGGGYLGRGRGWLLSVTPLGAVWTTEDGGARWSARALSDCGAQTAAAFSGSVGWAAGADCAGATLRANHTTVSRTADAGGSWARAAVLSGRPSALVVTPAGGDAWLMMQESYEGCPVHPSCGGTGIAVLAPGRQQPAVRTATGYVLTDLSPVSAHEAFALAVGHGTGYAVLHTEDAGRNWKPVYRTSDSGTPDRLWGFWSGGRGWAVGTTTLSTSLLQTQDGGHTWRWTGAAPVASIVAAGFTDRTHGWLVTDGGRVLATSDGGRTWDVQGHLPRCGFLGYPAQLGFFTPSRGWILSGPTKCAPVPAVLITRDGGRSWSHGRPVPGYTEQVAFASPRDGWAISRPATPGPGARTTLIATHDGGRSWNAVADLGPVSWSAGESPPPLWVGLRLAAGPGRVCW